MPRRKAVDDPRQIRIAEVAKEKRLDIKTFKSYLSYYSSWRTFERIYNIPYPFKPGPTYADFGQWLARDCEYGEGTIRNTMNAVKAQHLLMTGVFDYNDKNRASEEVTNAVKAGIKQGTKQGDIMAQADPLTISQYRKLSPKMRAFTAMWCQTGQRLATASNWMAENKGFVNKELYIVYHTTAKFMPPNHPAIAPIGCNCTDRHGPEFCIICNVELREQLREMEFPVDREEVEKEFALVGATSYAVRRLAAIYITNMAARVDARKFYMTARHLQVIGKRINYSFLWSKESVTYKRYGSDAFLWNMEKLVPCMAMAKFIFNGEEKFPIDLLWPNIKEPLPGHKAFERRQAIFDEIVKYGRIRGKSENLDFHFEGAAAVISGMFTITVGQPDFRLNFDIAKLDGQSQKDFRAGLSTRRHKFVTEDLDDLSDNPEDYNYLHSQYKMNMKFEKTRLINPKKKKNHKAGRTFGFATRSDKRPVKKRGKRREGF